MSFEDRSNTRPLQHTLRHISDENENKNENKRTQRAQTSLVEAGHYPNIGSIPDLESLIEGMSV